MNRELRGLVYDMLVYDEGLKHFPYDDATGKIVKAPIGKITIGIGHNLQDRGLSSKIILKIFFEDIRLVWKQLKKEFKDIKEWKIGRQLALINMGFNLGYNGLLKFKRMIRAIHNKDWNNASKEALDSKWATQVPARANRVAYMLKTGNILIGE